jgi:hypothetical protein
MAIGDSLDMDIEPFVERLVGIFEYMNADMRYKSSVDKVWPRPLPLDGVLS